MPVKYSVDVGEALVTTVVDAEATPEEMLDYLDRIMGDAQARGLDRLVLLGEIDTRLFSTGAINELAELSGSLDDGTLSFRLAIVAPSPARFGLSRMFALRNVRPGERQAVFHDVASARRWLGRPPIAGCASGF